MAIETRGHIDRLYKATTIVCGHIPGHGESGSTGM
jgi:hypothetical protein